MPRSLLSRLLILLSLVVGAAGLALLLADAREERRDIVRAETARVAAIATTLAPRIDAATLLEAETQHAGKDGISSWARRPPPR